MSLAAAAEIDSKIRSDLKWRIMFAVRAKRVHSENKCRALSSLGLNIS
jgi:hypothetical protein